MNIACFGWYNKSNLGDDLIKRALKCIFNAIHNKTNQEYNISFIHDRFHSDGDFIGIKDYYLKGNYDALILGSGGVFPRHRIRNFTKYLLISLKCPKYYFIGIGIDPIIRYKRAYEYLCKKALHIFVRDHGSAKNIYSCDAEVSTDLVIACKDLLFQLKPPPVADSSGSRIWIICKHDTDPRHFDFYLKLVNILLYNNYQVTFMAFGEKDYCYTQKFKHLGIEAVMTDADDVSDYFNSIKDDDIVIAERYHGMVLSLIFRKKFIPLIYDYKQLYLLDDIEWEENKYLLNYDSEGYLYKMYCPNPYAIVEDVKNISKKCYEKYYNKIDEMSIKAMKQYYKALKNIQ